MAAIQCVCQIVDVFDLSGRRQTEGQCITNVFFLFPVEAIFPTIGIVIEARQAFRCEFAIRVVAIVQ